MPSKSKAQMVAMRIAAHGKSNIGIPERVGEKFVEEDKAKGKNVLAKLPMHKCKNALSKGMN